MSDYWVSRPKWTCKYCDITINDDVPSRRQHENGLRHKGNVERFLREQYKKGDRERREKAEEAKEMKKIEEAALAAHAKDLAAAGIAPPAPQPTPDGKGKDKSTDVWKNYTTAASLGIADPESEQLEAEQELRKTEGRAGEWEMVAPPPPPSSTFPQGASPLPRSSVSSVGQDQGEEDDPRSFRIRERKSAGLLGDDDEYDLGEIKVKKRPRRQGPTPEELEEERRRQMPTAWTPLSLSRNSPAATVKDGKLRTDDVKDVAGTSLSGGTASFASPSPGLGAVKMEGGEGDVEKGDDIVGAEVKKEEAEADAPRSTEAERSSDTPPLDGSAAASPTAPATGGSLFKKRKTAGANAKRGRVRV